MTDLRTEFSEIIDLITDHKGPFHYGVDEVVTGFTLVIEYSPQKHEIIEPATPSHEQRFRGSLFGAFGRYDVPHKPSRYSGTERVEMLWLGLGANSPHVDDQWSPGETQSERSIRELLIMIAPVEDTCLFARWETSFAERLKDHLGKGFFIDEPGALRTFKCKAQHSRAVRPHIDDFVGAVHPYRHASLFSSLHYGSSFELNRELIPAAAWSPILLLIDGADVFDHVRDYIVHARKPSHVADPPTIGESKELFRAHWLVKSKDGHLHKRKKYHFFTGLEEGVKDCIAVSSIHKAEPENENKLAAKRDRLKTLRAMKPEDVLREIGKQKTSSRMHQLLHGNCKLDNVTPDNGAELGIGSADE